MPRHAAHDWRDVTRSLTSSRLVRACVVGVSLVVATVLSTPLRHWMLEALTAVCVLGGILAAPVVSLIAWLGLVLPENTGLHRIAPVLFGAALIWLCLAILGAHARGGERGKVRGS